jgi:hypothetical protein
MEFYSESFHSLFFSTQVLELVKKLISKVPIHLRLCVLLVPSSKNNSPNQFIKL